MAEINILEIKKVSKSFVGIDVLNKVDLEARQGETLALLGGNGAGKSTLIKIILGVEQASSGEVWFDGKLKNYTCPNDAYEDGVLAMFQETSLVPQLSILQNVFLGAEILKPFGRLDEDAMLQKFEKTCKDMDLRLDPHTLVSALSAANQKLVEIVKALTRRSRFIIMDEPTDSLSPVDTERLLHIIQNLNSQNDFIKARAEFDSMALKKKFSNENNLVRQARNVGQILSKQARNLVFEGFQDADTPYENNKRTGGVLYSGDIVNLYEYGTEKNGWSTDEVSHI